MSGTPDVAVWRRLQVPVAGVYVPMPSTPSPFQSPVTGIVVGQLPLPKTIVLVSPLRVSRSCQVPLR
jgi:hypothetical protein